jgi:hypothetical protein
MSFPELQSTKYNLYKKIKTFILPLISMNSLPNTFAITKLQNMVPRSTFRNWYIVLIIYLIYKKRQAYGTIVPPIHLHVFSPCNRFP